MARFEFTCLLGHKMDVTVPSALVDQSHTLGATWMLAGIRQNFPCGECYLKLRYQLDNVHYRNLFAPRPGVCSICGGPTPCLRQD